MAEAAQQTESRRRVQVFHDFDRKWWTVVDVSPERYVSLAREADELDSVIHGWRRGSVRRWGLTREAFECTFGLAVDDL